MDGLESVTEVPEPACTCYLEPGFMAAENYAAQPPNEPDGTYSVVDAEGVIVAECKDQRYGDLVAHALTALDAKGPGACLRHDPGRRLAVAEELLRECIGGDGLDGLYEHGLSAMYADQYSKEETAAIAAADALCAKVEAFLAGKEEL